MIPTSYYLILGALMLAVGSLCGCSGDDGPGQPQNPQPQRVVAESMKARQACFWATPCGNGCSIRANFQSTTVLIPPALATGNVDIVPDAMVREVLEKGLDYGRSSLGGGRKVNVEFVSANPTGPMHVAHARGAVVGDALASLLDFAGYAVTREYYINDGGGQVDVLARSAYERYREANGLSPELSLIHISEPTRPY